MTRRLCLPCLMLLVAWVPVLADERILEYQSDITVLADVTQRLAENAPLSMRASKITIDTLMKDPGERDLARMEAVSRACFASDDFKEGRTAFMEKRKPAFRGR